MILWVNFCCVLFILLGKDTLEANFPGGGELPYKTDGDARRLA